MGGAGIKGCPRAGGALLMRDCFLRSIFQELSVGLIWVLHRSSGTGVAGEGCSRLVWSPRGRRSESIWGCEGVSVDLGPSPGQSACAEMLNCRTGVSGFPRLPAELGHPRSEPGQLAWPPATDRNISPTGKRNFCMALTFLVLLISLCWAFL